jgi:hypothetical protein
MPNLQPLVGESDAAPLVAVRPEAAAVFGSHRVFERPVRSRCNQIDEEPKKSEEPFSGALRASEAADPKRQIHLLAHALQAG